MRLILLVFTLTLSLLTFATADEKSGPGRTTLESFEGGTIFVVTDKASSAKRSPGEITVKTDTGKVLVKSTPWGFDVVTSQGTIKVSSSLNDLTVDDGKQKIKISSQFGGKTVVDVPGSKMTFQAGLSEVVVSGPKGTLKVEQEFNNLKLVSSVGTTRLVREYDGFKHEGPVVSKHPYTWRALILEREGVGVLLNLLPYQHEALRPALDWDRVKSI
ncbi:MAG: hypothetical protein WC314_09095 [Vulcanimicrobiota bacterium]